MNWTRFTFGKRSGQERDSLLDPELTHHVISSLELAVAAMDARKQLMPDLNYRVTLADLELAVAAMDARKQLMPDLNYRVTLAGLEKSVPSESSRQTFRESDGLVLETRKEMLTHLAPALTIYADQYRPFFDPEKKGEGKCEGILGRLPLNSLPTVSSAFLGEPGLQMRDQIYILNYTDPLTAVPDRNLSDDAGILRKIVPAAAGLLINLHSCFDHTVDFQRQCQYLHAYANDLDAARVGLDLGLNQSLTRENRQMISLACAGIRNDRFAHFVRGMAEKAANASTVLAR